LFHIPEERTCELDYKAKPNISDTAYQNAAKLTVRSLFGDKFENSKLRDVFLIIYPYIQDRQEFNPYKLFRMLSKEEREKVKSGPALANYLERLVKIDLIEHLPESAGKYRLSREAEARFGQIFQIVLGRHFMELLEPYYASISALSCIIARRLREDYPSNVDSEIVDFTRALIEIGVRVTCDDLLRKQVLVRPCIRCLYPLRREDYNSNQDILGEVIESDISIKERIRRFILLKDQGKGISSDEIIAYLQQFGVPPKAIDEGIAQLYRMGELYRTETGGYKVWRLKGTE